MKIHIALVLLISIFLSVPMVTASAESSQNIDLKLKLNGAFLIYSKGSMPYIDNNNRTLVPLRIFSDALDGEISWNNDTKTVTLVASELTLTSSLDKKEAIINGKNMNMDTTVVINKGTVMVPAKWVADGLGIPIIWDSKNKVVSLNHEKFFLTGPLERMTNEQHVDFDFDPQIIPMSISYGKVDGYEDEHLKINIYNNSENTYQGQLQDHLIVLINNKTVNEAGTRGETNSDYSDLRLVEKIEPNKTYEYFLPVGRLDQVQLQVDYPQYAFYRIYKYKLPSS